MSSTSLSVHGSREADATAEARARIRKIDDQREPYLSFIVELDGRNEVTYFIHTSEAAKQLAASLLEAIPTLEAF